MQKQRITDENPWLKYVISAVAGLAIVIAYSILKGILQETETIQVILILSNAFLLAGVLLLGIGLLSLVKKEGTFDGLFYSFHSVRMAYTKRMYNEVSEATKDKETYYDYKQNAKAKRKVAWHMIVVGAGYLLVAIVFTIIFSRLYNG